LKSSGPADEGLALGVDHEPAGLDPVAHRDPPHPLADPGLVAECLPGPLHDEIPLHLGQGSEGAEDDASDGALGIEPLLSVSSRS
jgi:hypothetical protein